MKVNVNAYELHDAAVTHVSLVKNGAIRSPFKILKTEDLPAPSSTETFADKVLKFFGKEDQPVQVTALWVAGDVEKYEPMIKDAGFSVDEKESTAEGITLYKQEGYDADKEVSGLALNSDIVVGVDSVSKMFSPTTGTDFKENVYGMSFMPSFGDASGSLGATIWNILETSVSTDDASTKIGEALNAFKAHVQGLVKTLPTSVFKLDRMLRNPLDSINVAKSSDVSAPIEEKTMTKLREAMPGDHAGLATPVVKADEPVTTETVAEDVVEKEETPAEEPVVETPVLAVAPSLTDEGLKAFGQALAGLTSMMTGLVKTVEKQGEQIEAITKQHAEVVEKAESTTRVISWDFDESLSPVNRTRQVQKAEAAPAGVFDNLFTDIRL